ncbi:Protein YrdA [Zhongshania aliphaticivorans]|uniref:Protein YrdA n=1 Tax=Zhongshania aliphaticivorans TaxID=1470434 RepID=A0A5S9PL47_9GAMM|nr:gamma carbonic anhydrase family protein [Zhongshania aliphaticivorans]CAA0104627.1 Protein YrdA [Zhongshania aliphaticivorans]CAA0104884.1 Protein YrdA [Zhongshania aliphaticivorans]
MNYRPQQFIRRFEEHHPKLGERVFIDPSAVVIGNVSIGDDSSIWPNTTVRGDMHSISIGAKTSIQDNSVLHITHAGPYNPEGYPLQIGDEVTVAHSVTLHGCTIGNCVLIGMGSIVMDGAVIEDNVVVGANSLIPPGKHLASGWLYVGSPAKPVRALSKGEYSYFSYSAANYAKLKDRHIAALSTT